ncbi:5794_t:CDS:2, partial [Racocetra fulgida]
MVEKCLFCQIVNHEKAAFIIAENEKALAILDAFPVSDGHTLIITKEHFPNLATVDAKSWEYLLPLIQEIINNLSNAKLSIPPQGFNIISNMNEIAYQSIPHLHLHIIPKYEKDQGFIWNSQSQLKYSLLEMAQNGGEDVNCHLLPKPTPPDQSLTEEDKKKIAFYDDLEKFFKGSIPSDLKS